MTPDGPGRKWSAFTLIEVVVALALGVLLMVAAQRLVLRAQLITAELEALGDASAGCVLPLELLELDLANRPAGGGVSLQNGELSLTTANAMQTVETYARHGVAVSYHLQRAPDGQLSLLRSERELGDESPVKSGVSLAAGLSAVRFEIFDGQGWQPTWPLPVSRPAYALRVTLAWVDGREVQRTIQLAPLRWRRHDE